jgi:hypothetical protein
MFNWHSIEAEADFRRHEWEREVTADARAALAVSERAWPNWLHLPRLSLSGLNLRRLQTPRLSFAGNGTSSQAADCAC